jgi:hypothetical protein
MWFARIRRSLFLLLLTGCSDCSAKPVMLMPRDGGVIVVDRPCTTCDVLPPGAKRAEVVMEATGSGCLCRAVECLEGYRLLEHACVRDELCSGGMRWEGWSCVPAEDVGCDEEPDVPYCVPTSDAPPPDEGCTKGCHDGTEDPHPWFGGPSLTCTGCHGGNPNATAPEEAHVRMPDLWQVNSPAWGRPNLRYYFNYLSLAGTESFQGGLEWLRFRNPGDLRIADQTCGQSMGCHRERVENVRRSIMATAAGVLDGALAASGVARSVVRDGDVVYKWDATRGMTLGRPQLDALVQPPAVGSIAALDRLLPINREVSGWYDQTDLLIDLYDKACNGCHLGDAGANARYGDFRSSGCSACHVVYRLDGRSQSKDPMIRKSEPSYPAAYTEIAGFDPNDLYNLSGKFLGPERPHPSTHRMVRRVGSRRCGTCHSGSNRTDLQLRGYEIDPNRTALASLDLGRVAFTDELDNDAYPFARYHGLAEDQILRFVDWDDDSLNDIPADVHYLAGLECIDCHTGREMHNELEVGRGAIWSRMDQATEIECVDCHGNLEHRALPAGGLIACAELGETIPDYAAPAECAQLGRGRWLKGKLSGRWHYVPQTFDTATPGGTATFPDAAPVHTENAEIFHGRSDTGFSHLGAPAQSPADQMAGGLECYACHSTWANVCYGCHLRLSDNDNAIVLHDFSRATGELTLGLVVEARVDAISPLDLQYGINAEGKIAQLLPESKQHVAHTDYQAKEYFGTQIIVNDDASVRYNVYRDRLGYGLRRYAIEPVGLPLNSDGLIYVQDPLMDGNAGLGSQPFMPHTVQRSHPRMDCTNCHLDLEGTNEDAIAARYGYRPDGFAGVSSYLANAEVVFDANAGYRFDTTVVVQADWCLDRETGFPYCSSNHPPRVAPIPSYRREHPGSLSLELIRKLSSEVRAVDVGVQLRGPR